MQANNILIIANVLSFFFLDQFKLGLTPMKLWNNFKDESPKLLTSAFAHADITHILFNMIALYTFGRVLESEIGNIRYFVFYIGSAVLTSLIYAMLARDSSVVSLGASGAISAVMGLYMFKSNQKEAFWRVLQYQFVGLLIQSHTGINYLAHLIGFGLGWVAYFLNF